ncbi:MAG TPA: plasmid partitioning protein RepB C-terminal domain-containing protein [Magnetospirillaceae bacterium]|jgi:hypothetical protein
MSPRKVVERQQIAIAAIQPLRHLSTNERRSTRFRQFVIEVGRTKTTEPLEVAPDRARPGVFLLLDGLRRHEALRTAGVKSIACIVNTDLGAISLNRRINGLTFIQQDEVIRASLAGGMPATRVQAALKICAKSLHQRLYLVGNLCDEAKALLRAHPSSIHGVAMFGHMAPARQIEAAELMIAMNDFRAYYARLLLAATPADKLVRSKRSKIFWGVSEETQRRIAAESEVAERRFRIARLTYASDQFALTVAKGYAAKLLRDDKVAGYLARYRPAMLETLERTLNS